SAEFILRKAIYRAVPITVAGKVMSSGLNVPHQMRKAFSDPPYNKERSFGVMLVKKIKNALGARHHTRGPAIPAFAVNRPGKSLHLKVILHIHAKYVCQVSGFVILAQNPSSRSSTPI